mgnify:CR=1 FL=1
MKKPQWILIGITGAFVCLLLGIFIGRNLTGSYVSVGNLGNSEQVSVNTSDTSSGTSEDFSEKKDGKININTADAKQLALLPGIGEVLAQRIVDYRTEFGLFESVDDLTNVNGIGEKKLEQLKPYAKVE